jgi:hypothetical protein
VSSAYVQGILLAFFLGTFPNFFGRVVATELNKEAAQYYPPGTDEKFAPLSSTAQQSASLLLNIFDTLTPERNGSFLNHKNEVLPW